MESRNVYFLTTIILEIKTLEIICVHHFIDNVRHIIWYHLHIFWLKWFWDMLCSKWGCSDVITQYFEVFLFAFEPPYRSSFIAKFLENSLLSISSKTWKCTLCLLNVTQFTPMLYTFVFSILSMYFRYPWVDLSRIA